MGVEPGADQLGVIAVETRPRLPGALFPHVWLLPITAEVAGQRRVTRWRRPIEFEVAPGRHRVEVRATLMGREAIEVLVDAGERVVVSFGGARVRFGDAAITAEGRELAEEVYGLAIGERVRHHTWGEGTIEAIVRDEAAGTTVASIRFDSSGIRRVDLDTEELTELR